MTATIPSQRASSSATAVSAVNLTKVYGEEGTAVHALDDVTVEFRGGEYTAIMGPSGSGKSTLLHLMAGLDEPTSGQVWMGEHDITEMSDRELTLLRRDHIGFIFQAFNLLPTLTAAENITLPLDIAGHDVDREWVDQVIDAVDIRPRLAHRPAELSGGQQQRVAAARALATKPDVVFADEPTGALDSHAAADLLGFLRTAVHEFGQTVVIVTHAPAAASYSDRVVFLRDGQTV